MTRPPADTERRDRTTPSKSSQTTQNGIYVVVKRAAANTPLRDASRTRSRLIDTGPHEVWPRQDGWSTLARDRERGGTALRRHARRPMNARYRHDVSGHRVANARCAKTGTWRTGSDLDGRRVTGRRDSDIAAARRERGGTAHIWTRDEAVARHCRARGCGHAAGIHRVTHVPHGSR